MAHTSNIINLVFALSACAKPSASLIRVTYLSTHLPRVTCTTTTTTTLFDPLHSSKLWTLYLVTYRFLLLLFLLWIMDMCLQPCLVLLFCFPSFKDLVFNFLAYLLVYLATRTFRQIYKIKSYANFTFSKADRYFPPLALAFWSRL